MIEVFLNIVLSFLILLFVFAFFTTIDYSKFKKPKENLELLIAKQAVFKMIRQFCHPKKMFDNDETLYIYDYCESALESAFNVLGIEKDYIPLMDFCKMWEDNDRAIWNIYNPDDEYKGITADIYYKVFVEDYEARLRWTEEEYDN